VELTGQGQAVNCHIDPGLMNPDEPGRLEALLVEAINDAQSQLRQLASRQTAELTDAAGLGGLLQMLGLQGVSSPSQANG
jgi:DNA-binding protein YbaB